MPDTVSRLAPAAICREFEADVLAQLAQAGAAMHGCPVVSVECRLDGSVAIWFAGARDGARWRGALRFSFPWLSQRKFAADAGAVTQIALQLLDSVSLRAAPLIQRATA
jgi:hypothetical protein